MMSQQERLDSRQIMEKSTDIESHTPISLASSSPETTSTAPQTPHPNHKQHHQGSSSSSSSKMAVKFFKTKLCPWYSQGRCRLGSNCNWAHNLQEVRDSVDLSRTKLCHHLTTQGKCTDPTCRFAHRREELRATTDVYKTSLCVFWMRGGCFIGQKCRYAHGLNDLRHYSAGSGSHRPASRSPDLLMLDSPKERDTDDVEKESGVVKVDKMGWTDPSLAAVAHALSSSSGSRVASRQGPTFEPKGNHSPTSASDTPKSVSKPRSTRLHIPPNQKSPNSNHQRPITQDELMTAMEALQSLLRVPTTQSQAMSLSHVPTSASLPHAASTPILSLQRKLSNSSASNQPDCSGEAAASRLLAIAEKMTNLELASRGASGEGFTSPQCTPSPATSEPSFKEVVDSLSWVIPSTMRDSESSIRDIAKRLEEIDVRARFGLVQELKAAAVLSVVAANATLTTAEDLNTQIGDMLSAMRRAQMPWHLAMPSRGTDDQTTTASTHLGSGSERTDSVSNVSWPSYVPLEETGPPAECPTTQEDLMLSQLLEVIRRNHTRL